MKINFKKIVFVSVFLGILVFYVLVTKSGFNAFAEEKPFLNEKGILFYTNIVSVRNSKELTDGKTIQTKGYYYENDGGAGQFIVRKRKTSDVDDGGSLIFLNNGNVAELIKGESVNVKQFGARGDNLADDTQKIQNAINYIENKNGGLLYFPEGQYKVSDTVTVNSSNVKIKGADKNTAVLRPTENLILDSKKYSVKWTLAVNNINRKKQTKLNGRVDAGAKKIVVHDAIGVEPGMLVYIKGNFATSPWTSNNRGNAVKGETNKVLSVSGNLVNLSLPVSDFFAKEEDVTVTFLKPLVGIEIKGLGVSCPDSCPEDERQYRGFVVIGCEQAVITDCYGNGCGTSCFESVSSFKTTISNNVVKNAWSYKTGSMAIYGLGYGLRATSDSYTKIINNKAEECRHCVDVSGNSYPSHNILVANNTLKSSVSLYGVLSTHGPAKSCIFENNVAEGPVSILVRGEKITVKNNVLRGKILNYFGRNNTYVNNEIYGGITFRPEDTVEHTNFNIIENNVFFIKSNTIINLKNGKVPFTAANGWVVKDNTAVLLDNRAAYVDTYMFNVKNTKSEKVDFRNGFEFKNNNVCNHINNKTAPIKLCQDMTKICLQ